MRPDDARVRRRTRPEDPTCSVSFCERSPCRHARTPELRPPCQAIVLACRGQHRLESDDNRRVELRAGRLSQAEARDPAWHGVSVWAVGRHGVVSVGDGDDPRDERDLVGRRCRPDSPLRRSARGGSGRHGRCRRTCPRFAGSARRSPSAPASAGAPRASVRRASRAGRRAGRSCRCRGRGRTGSACLRCVFVEAHQLAMSRE